VDILTVVSNATVLVFAFVKCTVAFTGMLLTAVMCSGTVSVKAKVALHAGSSQQGKARRASQASN
jgi:hypothetical protein